ncbi:MAG: hypothetical protein J7L15_01225 [Clostridiales bacterium]|nr:hypothetical protein [Clostridiales bacterium]
MIYNLKKISQPINQMQQRQDPMQSLDFMAAANKVLALHPEYSNIQDFMSNPPMELQNIRNPDSVINYAASINAENLEQAVQPVQNTEQAVDQLQSVAQSSYKKVKAFNLKTVQSMNDVPADPMGLNDSPELIGDQMQMQDEVNQDIEFQEEVAPTEEELIIDEDSLKSYLESHDEVEAVDYFEGHITDERGKILSKIELKEIYEEIPEMPLDPARKTQIYANLLKYLGKDTMEIPVQQTQVTSSNKAIKKLAEDYIAKKQAKKTEIFNFKKTAQHKTQENIIMYGPESTRIDPFYRYPVSDWHIMERNKGWGQDIGGIWNIDYETLWRTHIMDKYSRPYVDKEGKLVGGYINKRFEVDGNIPEASNYHLKPGQLRKPYLPQYGSTEARLQEARSKGDIKGANDTSKPFNWKEASSKKKR